MDQVQVRQVMVPCEIVVKPHGQDVLFCYRLLLKNYWLGLRKSVGQSIWTTFSHMWDLQVLYVYMPVCVNATYEKT